MQNQVDRSKLYTRTNILGGKICYKKGREFEQQQNLTSLQQGNDNHQNDFNGEAGDINYTLGASQTGDPLFLT